MSSQVNTDCNGIDCFYDGPSIIINEVMLAPTLNDGSIYGTGPGWNYGDNEGEWIELYNPDKCNSVDISCYFLGNNAPESGINYAAGFVLPENTIIPPQGFCLIRGIHAPPVPPQYLVQNGGNTVEIVLTGSLYNRICLSGGWRLWFPNAGGWFAFYDRNGVPQDAISYGSTANSCMSCNACNPGIIGNCNFSGQLVSYNAIPANRKTYITTSLTKGYSHSRIPDGANWAINTLTNPTMGRCNTICVSPPQITCNGSATVTPNGGTLPYTYKWNDSQNQTTQTATGLCEGTYCVTVTSAINQTASACVQVNNHTLAIVATSPNPSICQGESLQFQGTQGANYSYQWSGPNNWSGNNASHTLPNASPNMSGIYSVTVTNSYGCTGSASIALTVHPNPSISVTANPIAICQGDETVLTAYGANVYMWSHSLPQEPSHSVSPQITTNYSVTGTSVYGCTGESSVVVTVHPLPDVHLVADPEQICKGSTSSLFATGAIQYAWSGGLTAGSNHIVQPDVSTSYSVTGTNEHGCFGVSSVDIVVHLNPIISIEAVPSEICVPGQEVSLQAFGGQNYIWSNMGEQGQHITVFPTGTTSYAVTGTDSEGCTGTSEITVELVDQIALQLTASPQQLCYGQSSVISVTGAAMYVWSPNVGNVSVFTVQPETTTTYFVTGTNSYGCTGTSDITITVIPLPSASFEYTPPSGCMPLTVFFENHSDDGEYFWDFGNSNHSNEANPNYTFNNAGSYYVSLTVTSNGCTNTFLHPIPVRVYPNPFAAFSVSSNVVIVDEATVTFTDESIGAVTWLWTFGENDMFSNEQNPSYTFMNEGVFEVCLFVENQWACVDFTCRNIVVNPFVSFYIPNAFSPNGDGINDWFFPMGTNIDEENFIMRIYDRWGGVVFEANSFEEAKWDGTYQFGKKMSRIVPPDVYIYTISVVISGLQKVFNGTITVVY